MRSQAFQARTPKVFDPVIAPARAGVAEVLVRSSVNAGKATLIRQPMLLLLAKANYVHERGKTEF